MKVLHISTHDYGGAGKAALRLNRFLRAEGLDSRLLVLYKKTNESYIYTVGKRALHYKLRNLVARARFKLQTDRDYFFQQQLFGPVRDARQLCQKLGFQPDIILPHWISNFLTLSNLSQMQEITGAPIVWYLMDMAPLTGGCHYAWKCDGYLRECGKCPALRSKDPGDLSYQTWKLKQNALEKMKLAAATGSNMLVGQALRSSLFSGREVRRIMVGLDLNVFRRGERREARRKLGLPEESKIIFFGNLTPNERRKGLKSLVDALNYLAERQPASRDRVILITPISLEKIELGKNISFLVRNLGVLDDDGLAAAYQAADLFVSPSIEDSGPMMVNEAITCGTPVVAFNMGVAIDLIRTGETGYLATLMDANDLARGIQYILELDSVTAKTMSFRCAELGRRLCGASVQTKSFLDLFQFMRDGEGLT